MIENIQKMRRDNNIKDDIMGAAAENVRTREEKTERKIKFFLSLF